MNWGRYIALIERVGAQRPPLQLERGPYQPVNSDSEVLNNVDLCIEVDSDGDVTLDVYAITSENDGSGAEETGRHRMTTIWSGWPEGLAIGQLWTSLRATEETFRENGVPQEWAARFMDEGLDVLETIIGEWENKQK